MTRIDALLAGGRTLSVELWPPRDAETAVRLQRSLERLEELRPDFASITYGAAGSTRDRTHDLVVSLQKAGKITPMAHLTCAAHRRQELADILVRYRQAGIENVLALRGDPPLDSAGPLLEGELPHAIDLVGLTKEIGGFCIAVAAYAGGHPEAPSKEADLERLAAKMELADLAITQIFFRVSDYLELVEALARRGIDKPVLPGVMPVTNARSLERMAQLSGATPPSELVERLRGAADPEAVRKVGVEIATELCEQLLQEGAPGLHFYTMNLTRATIEVCRNLGLVPRG